MTTEYTTATATCPDCGRSQTYMYPTGDRLAMIRTAATALETLPHELDCPRHTLYPRAKADASTLQAALPL